MSIDGLSPVSQLIKKTTKVKCRVQHVGTGKRKLMIIYVSLMQSRSHQFCPMMEPRWQVKTVSKSGKSCTWISWKRLNSKSSTYCSWKKGHTIKYFERIKWGYVRLRVDKENLWIFSDKLNLEKTKNMNIGYRSLDRIVVKEGIRSRLFWFVRSSAFDCRKATLLRYILGQRGSVV